MSCHRGSLQWGRYQLAPLTGGKEPIALRVRPTPTHLSRPTFVISSPLIILLSVITHPCFLSRVCDVHRGGVVIVQPFESLVFKMGESLVIYIAFKKSPKVNPSSQYRFTLMENISPEHARSRSSKMGKTSVKKRNDGALGQAFGSRNTPRKYLATYNTK